jgi:hypothetical protein
MPRNHMPPTEIDDKMNTKHFLPTDKPVAQTLSSKVMSESYRRRVETMSQTAIYKIHYQ